MKRQILLAAALLMASATAAAENGCMMFSVTSPHIVIDRAMGQAHGFITVSLTCTEGLAFALDSPLTPDGVIDLFSGAGGVLPATIREDATDAPLGPMSHGQHLGLTGTGTAQAVNLRVEIDLPDGLPVAGAYAGIIVLSLEY